MRCRMATANALLFFLQLRETATMRSLARKGLQTQTESMEALQWKHFFLTKDKKIRSPSIQKHACGHGYPESASRSEEKSHNWRTRSQDEGASGSCQEAWRHLQLLVASLGDVRMRSGSCGSETSCGGNQEAGRESEAMAHSLRSDQWYLQDGQQGTVSPKVISVNPV